MVLKSEIFSNVFDWLSRNKYVSDQKDLSHKTGITQTTISRIMTGKVEPSDDTLRKLNASFGYMFNMDFLRGKSNQLLAKDVKQEKPETKAEDPDPAPFIPTWADSFFDIMTQQIKDNEALNRELRTSISALTSAVASLNSVCTEMIRVLNSLKK